MNIRTLVGNGILAALYIAVSMLIQPFGFYECTVSYFRDV